MKIRRRRIRAMLGLLVAAIMLVIPSAYALAGENGNNGNHGPVWALDVPMHGFSSGAEWGAAVSDWASSGNLKHGGVSEGVHEAKGNGPTAASASQQDPQQKATKLQWYTVDSGSSDYVTDTPVWGHVNLNTPNGSVTMVINGVITLDPETTYAVWIREFTGYTGDSVDSYLPLDYYALGYFTTDEYGVGYFHYNISASDLTPGVRNIQLAINTTPTIGYTVAATPKYTIIEN